MLDGVKIVFAFLVQDHEEKMIVTSRLLGVIDSVRILLYPFTSHSDVKKKSCKSTSTAKNTFDVRKLR